MELREFWPKMCGPVTIAGGLTLLFMDIYSQRHYHEMAATMCTEDEFTHNVLFSESRLNISYTALTLLFGLLLTLITFTEVIPEVIMAWIVLDSMALLYGLALIIGYLVSNACDVVTMYAFQICWRKFCLLYINVSWF